MAKKTKQKKEKTFKIKRCPKCNTDEIGVIIGVEKKGEWECHKCSWKGKNVKEEILGEEDFMKYLDEKDGN